MHNSAQLRYFENGNDDFGVEAFWIGDAARVGYFVPLNGPLNGHPPSCILCNFDLVRQSLVFAFLLFYYLNIWTLYMYVCILSEINYLKKKKKKNT